MNDKLTWYRAAVIGSIWASVEIIFGGFFHSLRLPFAGTFLTFMSVVLLTAFSYKWSGRTLFIKAGLVAAVMRSMFPTAVIIGPFVGILTEAVLFQIFINLLGRNFIAFALAGIAAMFSAILHKIVSIIVIYGWDIVKILEQLYLFFIKSTGIHLPPEQLLYVVIGGYTVLGISAAVLGVRVGKRIKEGDFTTTGAHAIPRENTTGLFDLSLFHYRPGLLLVHLAALIIGFVLLEKYGLIYFLFLFVPYFIFLVYRYKSSFRRLKKRTFWIQLALIGLASFFLWPDKTEGLMVGIKLALRAVWVVSLFIAISVELKNPVVKSILSRKGYGELYTALRLATGILPLLVKELSQEKKMLFKPVKILARAISLSDKILADFLKEQNTRTPVFVVTGETSSGKTAFLKELLNELKKQNPELKVAGIISDASIENGEKTAYFVRDIRSGRKELLCDRLPGKEKLRTGRFYFYSEGIRFGNDILQNTKDAGLVIIDEVGRLELNGHGWHPAIRQLIAEKKPMIWTVKAKWMDVLPTCYPEILIHRTDIHDGKIRDFASKINKIVRK